MRIVFRSDDRYRGQTHGPPVAASPMEASPVAASPVGPGHEDEAAPPIARRPGFETRERHDIDGALRLTLLGDLDLTVTQTLSARLEELRATGRRVRLDLSQLAFIDSSGLQALLLALTDARWTGWQLEIAPELSPTVERAAQMIGIAQVLWPRERPDPGSDAPRSATPHELA
jgi:anti-anti-sigma factor